VQDLPAARVDAVEIVEDDGVGEIGAAASFASAMAAFNSSTTLSCGGVTDCAIRS